MSVALTGMTIELGMEYPHRIALRVGLDKDFTQDDVTSVVDLLTNVVEREHLKKNLADLKEHQEKNRRRIATNQSDRELETLKDDFDRELDVIRTARTAFTQQLSDSWANSSRRGEPKMNERQQKDLEKYDNQIAEKLHELDAKVRQNRKMKRDVELGISVTDWQIDCLYARIAGQAEPPVPAEVAANLKQLEMPEEASIPTNLAFTPIAA